MTRRMLDSRLWANDHFGEMSMMARLLLLGIINHADDQGRMKAKLTYLRTEIFRYDIDVTNEQVAQCLSVIQANETIIMYTVDGVDYIQLRNWWKYQAPQFAAPSEYPRPKGWQDRIRYNAKGGAVLACNWITPKGTEMVDTCDQCGKPLQAIADLPPRNPGGRPPQNPRYTIDQDQDQDLAEEGDRARMTEPPQPPPIPPLVLPAQILPGEYIPGVKRPVANQSKRNCDHYSAGASKHGCGPEPFRLMVDAVLDATGKTSLANTNGDVGQATLNQAKETVITLLEMGRRAIEDVQAVLASWRENDYRGASSPSFGQIVEHASAMDAGTHITVRRQDSAKKEFSSLGDYNEWAKRHDPGYKRIREGVLIKGTMIKRDNYQPAIRH